jgi:hydrogenase-4 membrane subunit HyfE
MVDPSLQQYGRNSLLFIIHKNEKLVRFTNFHVVHNSEVFFFNMLLWKIPFMMI